MIRSFAGPETEKLFDDHENEEALTDSLRAKFSARSL
jgi:hypothetical protein